MLISFQVKLSNRTRRLPKRSRCFDLTHGKDAEGNLSAVSAGAFFISNKADVNGSIGSFRYAAALSHS